MNTIGLHEDDGDKHFKLMADIDLSTYKGGTAFNIIGRYTPGGRKGPKGEYVPFRGVFDGNNHIISNFTYDCNGISQVALFRSVDGSNAEIRDLGLIDPNVRAEAGLSVGSLVGCLRDGTITGCYVEGGTVSGDRYVGVLVGANGGSIATSYSTGAVSGEDRVGGLMGINGGITNASYSAAIVTGGSSVVGLVGDNRGTISNCYSTGSVSGGDRVGELAGNTGVRPFDVHPAIPSMLLNCYSTGLVSGDSDVGGLVGLHALDTTTGSFWDIQTSGLTISDGGTGLTTAEMHDIDTYLNAGWDFVDETANGTDDIWWILEGRDYPRLWWELAPEH